MEPEEKAREMLVKTRKVVSKLLVETGKVVRKLQQKYQKNYL